MQGLKVENWKDWEELCCYFMQHIVEIKLNTHIFYQSYGSQGQSQFGIDLVPYNSSLPIVGQCKLRETTFTWNMVLAELKKTDSYKNPIEHYYLFTTANPHTTVQDIQNRGAYYYQRSNGLQFQVHVLYWNSIPDLDFIPREVLARIFPKAFKIATPSTLENTSITQFLASLPALRAYIPRVIKTPDLTWLETWNFSCGYVLEENYTPFNDLYLEYDRITKALSGIPRLIYEGNRVELAATLPAGDRFFSALSDFREAINSHIISGSLPDGTRTLNLNGLPQSFISQMTRNWTATATHLAQIYREDILGEAGY